MTSAVGLYRIAIHYYWNGRYQSDICFLLSELNELDQQRQQRGDENPFLPDPSKVPKVEESTKNMGYKIDPFVLLFPWFCSPILKWNAMTNFLIHCSFYITFYNLPFLESVESNSIHSNSDSESDPNPFSTADHMMDGDKSWMLSYADITFFELNWPRMINPFESGYVNLTLEYAVFRSIWSFLMWYILDYILWHRHYGLTYLFETGINDVTQRYTKQHCSMIHDLLSPHIEHIEDLNRMILSFHGVDCLEQFRVIKVKLHECLKVMDVGLLFNGLTLCTVAVLSMRFYCIPVVVNLINPICYSIGMIALFVFVLILFFNGIGSDALHLLREFDELLNYSSTIGVTVLVVTWAVIVWRNMQKKKQDLLDQQTRSMLKDYFKRVFENKGMKEFVNKTKNVDWGWFNPNDIDGTIDSMSTR